MLNIKLKRYYTLTLHCIEALTVNNEWGHRKYWYIFNSLLLCVLAPKVVSLSVCVCIVLWGRGVGVGGLSEIQIFLSGAMVWVWRCGGGRGQAPLRGMAEWWNASQPSLHQRHTASPIFPQIFSELYHLHIQHLQESFIRVAHVLASLCCQHYNTLKSSFLSLVIDNMSQIL